MNFSERILTSTTTATTMGDMMETSQQFMPAFMHSFLLTTICEFGDRTFFVAAIMASKSSRVSVWSGVLLAVTIITIISAIIGKTFPFLLERQYTSIGAGILFLYFGQQLLRDWWRMRLNEAIHNEELVSVEQELKSHTFKQQQTMGSSSSSSFKVSKLFAPALVKAFSLTMLAEVGDRSQIATIAIAASHDIKGVITGVIVGHALCTAVAVIGGRLLATRISERVVTLTGGLLFLAFAFVTFEGSRN